MNEIIKYFNLNTASFIVSTCAIVLTFIQGRSTIKHNRISVRPMLTTTVAITPLKDHPGVFVFEASLLNSGLGPAFIKSYKILIDGNPIVAKHPQELFPEIERALPRYKILRQISVLSMFRKDSVVASDASFVVAKIVVDPQGSTDLSEQLRRLQLLVKYDSVYGEHFTYDSRCHSED